MATAPSLSSTKEKTNYARLCRLLVDGGAQALGKTFDSYHPPATLQADLATPAVRKTLVGLKHKKVINPTQWGNLYPAIPSGVTSANFDISLLSVLLRNICPLTPPVSGWNSMPARGDVNIEDDIVRIRMYRNEICHIDNTSIPDTDFKVYWSEISQAVIRLGGKDYEDAIKKFKSETMDPDFEEHYINLLKEWCENERSIHEKVDAHGKECCENHRITHERLDDIDAHLKTCKKIKMVCSEGTQTEGDPSIVVGHLVDFYSKKASWIQPLPWNSNFQQPLQEIYTKLRMINREKSNSQLTDVCVGMYDIFKPTPYCSNVRKVLIEGNPGAGKTTFCQKIAYDWAVGNLEEENEFPDIKRVIFLRCCEFDSEDSLWTVIERELLPTDMGDAEKKSFTHQVQEDQEGSLVILDGLDEVNTKHMDPISSIMEGKLLSKCHLIVTARHEIGIDVRQYFDTLLEITGYTKADAEEYVKRYFNQMPSKADALSKNIQDNVKLSEIAKNPMNTALLCVLFEELEGCLPRTRTELYTMITECFLKRHASRESENPEVHPDIASVFYKDALISLGKVAFEALQEEKCDFDESKIIKHVACLGFLTKEISRSKIKPRCHYRFLHQSFQEYMAALYLSEHLKSRKFEFEDCVRHICSQIDILWQVIVFTAGLLEDDAQRYVLALFEHLKFHEGKREGRTFCVVLECLVENQNGADIASSILTLLPEKLNLQRCLRSDRKFVRLRGLSYIIAPVDDRLAPHSPLKVLNLSLNGLTDVDFEQLTCSLQRNNTIEVLDLRMNDLGKHNLYSCSQMLEVNSSIRCLILSWNIIKAEGFEALINSLQFNTSLTELFLDGNYIIVEGNQSSDLKVDKKKLNRLSLKILDLSANANIRGVRHFSSSQLIEGNNVPSLEHLDLSNCDCKELNEYASEFFRKLQGNNTLKTLNLSYTGFPPDLAKRDQRIILD